MGTTRLRLIACDEADLRAIVAGPAEASRRFAVAIPEGWPEFPEAYPYALSRVVELGDLRPWWTYVFLDDSLRALIGSGGFTGKPTAEGIVELGYETAPAFRGRGYASEAASGLLAIAFSFPEIRAVDAHTRPERNASVRVLERNGFTHRGVVEHPADGTIWHWRVERAGH
jgi:ribosomal-protein-alanine N-acetyltransferase